MPRQVRLSHELPAVPSQACPGSLIALHRIAQRVHRLSSFESGKTLVSLCAQSAPSIPTFGTRKPSGYTGRGWAGRLGVEWGSRLV